MTVTDESTVLVAPPFEAGLLLGPSALDAAYRSQVHGFLRGLARRRGIALHPAVAWNALYWGWDPATGAYNTEVLPVEDFPVVRMGDRGAAIPVGAMALVQSGAEPIWGEAIYKEGRSPLVDADGSVPAALSGTTAALDEEGAATLRESVVFDFAAGGGGPDTEHRVRRWARNGRWLDGHGHLVFDAVYDPGHDANLSDLHYFACWLWSQHFSALEHGWFRLHVGDSLTRPELWQALTASLECVASLLASTEGLRRWGSYYVDEAGYQERLAQSDLPLGAADFDYLAASLRRPPDGARVGYVALRPRLLEMAPHSPALDWTAYPATVCHASLRIAERAGEAVADGFTLRIDDLWQSAGIWRAERLDGGSECPLLEVPADVPLGCGAAAEAQDQHRLPGCAAELQPQYEELADTFVQWTATIRQVDIDEERLPLSEAASAALQPTADGRVLLRLEHQGEVAAEETHQPACRLSDDGRHLVEVRWPLDFFAGIRVWSSVQRGGSVVETATLPQEPVLAGGELRFFEFDASVLHPGARAAPEAGSRPVTLGRLLLEALRRRGRIDEAGDRRAEAAELAGYTFPHGVPEGMMPAVHRALDAALADGDLRRDGEEFVLIKVRRPASSVLPASSQWTERVDLSHRLMHRAHWVRLHFRRLPHGRWASEEHGEQRRAVYRRLIAETGLRGVYRPELPVGYTFVIDHVRGYGAEPTTEFP